MDIQVDIHELTWIYQKVNPRVGKGERYGVFRICLLKMADDLSFPLTISTQKAVMRPSAEPVMLQNVKRIKKTERWLSAFSAL